MGEPLSKPGSTLECPQETRSAERDDPRRGDPSPSGGRADSGSRWGMSEAASEKPIDGTENDRLKPADLVNANGAATNQVAAEQLESRPGHGRRTQSGTVSTADFTAWTIRARSASTPGRVASTPRLATGLSVTGDAGGLAGQEALSGRWARVSRCADLRDINQSEGAPSNQLDSHRRGATPSSSRKSLPEGSVWGRKHRFRVSRQVSKGQNNMDLPSRLGRSPQAAAQFGRLNVTAAPNIAKRHRVSTRRGLDARRSRCRQSRIGHERPSASLENGQVARRRPHTAPGMVRALARTRGLAS